jgi:hypothetical protein
MDTVDQLLWITGPETEKALTQAKARLGEVEVDHSSLRR